MHLFLYYSNTGMLGWDVISLIPGVPGVYVAKEAKYLNKTDEVVSVTRTIEKWEDAYSTAKAFGNAEGIYKGGNAIENTDIWWRKRIHRCRIYSSRW